VKEALQLSARLRLPNSIPSHEVCDCLGTRAIFVSIQLPCCLCKMASVAPELWHTAVYHEQSPSVQYDCLGLQAVMQAKSYVSKLKVLQVLKVCLKGSD